MYGFGLCGFSEKRRLRVYPRPNRINILLRFQRNPFKCERSLSRIHFIHKNLKLLLVCRSNVKKKKEKKNAHTVAPEKLQEEEEPLFSHPETEKEREKAKKKRERESL